MHRSGKTDREFIQACLAGNTQAFEALVDKYQALVCAITYSGTRRFDASEELAQETFLLAWRNLQQLKDLSKFREWLCRIARSTVKNWWRKGKRDVAQQAVSLGVANEQTSIAFEPSEVALQKEQQEVVHQALGHIPEKYREPLILFYREEKSAREVADALGLSESNARQRIARARSMLRDQVAAMVETTLRGSRPGPTFTGMVMAGISATAMKHTASATAAVQAGAHLGGSFITLCTGLVGKIVMVTTGMVVITAGVLWHQGRPGASSPNQVTTSAENSPAAEGPVANPPIAPVSINESLPTSVPTQTNPPAQNSTPKPSAPTQSLTASPVPAAPPLLSGKLTDKDTGKPIPEARVEISPDGGGRVYHTTTDANGMYSFKTVMKYGVYNLRPKTAEYITRADWERPRETIELFPDKPATRNFTLERGCKLQIKAINEAGQAVKRVSFYAVYVSDEMGRGPKDPVRTDANGCTFIGGLRPDEYLIVGAHRDYALLGQKIQFDQPQEEQSITFTLSEGIEVSGLATCSDDLPASGWEVWAKPIWWHSVRSWPYDDPAAEDGTFLLKHITPGLHRLEVYIPKDGGSSGIWSTEVYLSSETGFLDLRIPHPSPHERVSLSGDVTFIGGDYDRGFWIHGSSQAGHNASAHVKKGERRFTIKDLVPGIYDFSVYINGKRTNFENIQVPGETLLWEIPVTPKAQLNARVVDKKSREPVTQFKLRRPGEDTWQQMTDPNGLFTIDSYGQKQHRLLVQAPGYSEILSPPIPLDATEPLLIEMQLYPARTGRIFNEAGAPITDATVHYRYQHSAYQSPEDKVIAKTDAEGRFSMRIPPQTDNKEWFVFRHPDYARVIEHLVVSGENLPEIEVVMPPGGTVQGYAYDWQGALLPNTSIYFMDESDYSYWKENRARLAKVATDSNGFYRIDHLPTEMCYAFYHDPHRSLGIAKCAVLPQERQLLHFDIGGSWRTTGRLLQHGQALANTRLLVTFDKNYEQGFSAYAITNGLGEFQFCGLPSGERSLYAAVRGNRGREAWIELGSFPFQNGQDQQLGDLELHLAEVIVHLSLVGSTTIPQGWDVSIKTYDEEDFRGRSVGELAPRQQSQEPFVFRDVPLGELEVIATHASYPNLRQRLTIRPDQESYTLSLQIPAGSAILSGSVTALSETNSYLGLRLRNQDQTLVKDIRADAQGSFRIKHLPAGRYIIGRSSIARSRSSFLQEVTLKEGEQKSINLSIDPEDSGHGVHGYFIVSLVNEHGIPIATRNVWLERNGQVIKAHFDGDVDKSFMGEPGLYTLYADYPGYHPVRTQVKMQSDEERNNQTILDPVIITMSEL